MKNNKEVDILFQEIEKNQNGSKCHIEVKIPMNIGWINYMNIMLGNNSKELMYSLHHLKNEDGFVYYGGDFDIETQAIYRYFFTFGVNGKHYSIDKKGIFEGYPISKEECYKKSINFDVPKWAQETSIYHIFVDRFNRGSKKKPKESIRINIREFRENKEKIIKNYLNQFDKCSNINNFPNYDSKDWNEEKECFQKLLDYFNNEKNKKKIISKHVYKDFKEPLKIGPDENNIWNNRFYGGDLKGIEEKLDYIKKLGFDVIYLSPVFKSQSDHRYDTGDYEFVDDLVGINEDIKNLTVAAHKRGMKVILDVVYNHTGDDSKYFNRYGTYDSDGAYNNPYSPYHDMYTGDYWWGFKNLPVCDKNSLFWKNYITKKNGIIDMLFKLGIDGLRLDVADELTDEFIELIREAVRRNKKDGFVLGEVWDDATCKNRSFLESGKGMDTAMNYPLTDSLSRYFMYEDKNKFSNYVINNKNNYPDASIHSQTNSTSTHDTSRAINLFGCPEEFSLFNPWAWDLINSDVEYCKNFKMTKEQFEKGLKILKAYYLALAFMPGSFTMFYGDEYCTEGLGTLANRKAFNPVKGKKDIRSYIKMLNHMRKNYKDLFLGNEFNITDINNNYLIFERGLDEDRKVLLAVNRTNEYQKIILPNGYTKDASKKHKIYSLNNSTINSLSPYGGIIIPKTK